MCFKFNFGKRVSLKLIWRFLIFTCKDRRILVLTQRNNSRKFIFWKHLNVSLVLSFDLSNNKEQWMNKSPLKDCMYICAAHESKRTRTVLDPVSCIVLFYCCVIVCFLKKIFLKMSFWNVNQYYRKKKKWVLCIWVTSFLFISWNLIHGVFKFRLLVF